MDDYSGCQTEGSYINLQLKIHRIMELLNRLCTTSLGIFALPGIYIFTFVTQWWLSMAAQGFLCEFATIEI